MGSRDKVLIVDDSELDRIALKKMLKDAYEIVEAVDGAGALRILESQKEFDSDICDQFWSMSCRRWVGLNF